MTKAFNLFEIEQQNTKEDYPLFVESQNSPYHAYIALNVKTGAISCDTSTLKVCGAYIAENEIRILCDPMLSSKKINKFINENMDLFQSVIDWCHPNLAKLIYAPLEKCIDLLILANKAKELNCYSIEDPLLEFSHF